MERHDTFVHFQSSFERSGRSGINFSIRAIECYNERKGQLGLSHGICDNSIDLASFLSERGRPACILQKLSLSVEMCPTPEVPLLKLVSAICTDALKVYYPTSRGSISHRLRSHRYGAIEEMVRLFFFRSFLCFYEPRMALVS